VKDIYQVLWQKEMDIARVRMEVEALRFSIALLSDETDTVIVPPASDTTYHSNRSESALDNTPPTFAQEMRKTAS